MKTWNGLSSPVWDHVWKYAKLQFLYFFAVLLSELTEQLAEHFVFQNTKIIYFKRTSKGSEVGGAVWLEVVK